MITINENVVVKYQIYKEYCSCCGRDFEERELGQFNEFDFTLKNLFDWALWGSKDDIYEDEITETVEEYLYDTIRFYALNGNDELHIEADEIKRIEKMVREVIESM